ncbi:MAG: helix-turn-helix transcriptional regulator [Planctomycetota bacterium]|jgi:AraC-like DNA-binding protein
MDKKKNSELIKLLKASEEVLGLPICFHDKLNESDLPVRYKFHSTLPCKGVKKVAEKECVAFDVGKIRRELAMYPEGKLYKCPFNFLQLAAPVFSDNIFTGVLFAGPCTTSKKSKAPSLTVVPDKVWLNKRLPVLCAVAAKISEILNTKDKNKRDDRRGIITNYLMDNFDKPVFLSDIAVVLNVSESRCSHLIKELFTDNLPNIINNIRLKSSTGLLLTTDFNITEVARFCGFPDPNYFTKLFKKAFKLTPMQYRKKFKK